MNKSILILLFVGSFTFVDAQEVIATQGDSYTAAPGTLDFTIGEVVINTASNATTDLTQGFHQTNWKFSGLEDFAPEFVITVFPNPTSDYLHIQTTDYQNLHVELFDEAGKLVAQENLLTETTSIRVVDLATGNYSLVVSNHSGKLKLFKLIKSL